MGVSLKKRSRRHKCIGGHVGRWGMRSPAPPPSKKKIRYEVGPGGANFFVLKPKWDLEGQT